MAKATKKTETVKQRDTRLFKAFARMLTKVCTLEYGPGSYLGSKNGEVIKAERRGSIIQITIDSFDEPPIRSHLNLRVSPQQTVAVRCEPPIGDTQ